VPIHSPSWDNPDVVNAAVQFKPGTLRYPGGTVANYWDWHQGWFLSGALRSFLNVPRSTYRLQELQLAVQAMGAIPIYVLKRNASKPDLPAGFLAVSSEVTTPFTYGH
jgi:hypothetical protein